MKKQELKRKIDGLKYKISMIENYGGLVQDQMKQNLILLEQEFEQFKKEMFPLEAKFKEEYLKHHSFLQEELEKVYKQMDAIIAYSEEHGIAFKSKVRVFEDEYSPDSAVSNFEDFDQDLIKILKEETKCWSIPYGGGWQHSMNNNC